jgi:DNA-directed RNA polymerase subunit beta'
MRTFHIGGTAARHAEQTSVEARTDGAIKFINLNTVINAEGHHIVMNRNGEVAVVDETGREREKYAVVYGAKIKFARATSDSRRKYGRVGPLYNADPYEVAGKITFGDILEVLPWRIS